MSPHELQQESKMMTSWERHRFLLMIFGAIFVAMVLVGVAMSLYQNSGAAQVDFSRPGYKNVRKQATDSSPSISYPAEGELDDQALNDFKKLYEDQVKKTTGAPAFQPGALSDDSLQLYDKTDPQAAPTQ